MGEDTHNKNVIREKLRWRLLESLKLTLVTGESWTEKKEKVWEAGVGVIHYACSRNQ